VHPRTNEPSAPQLVRDLEVLWETGEINLQTLVWKQGMTEWKKIVDIPDLHRKILGKISQHEKENNINRRYLCSSQSSQFYQ